jgi:hypothetical protein
MELIWNPRLQALLNAPEPYAFFSMGSYILQNRIVHPRQRLLYFWATWLDTGV